jgi:uroporphyrinogen-III synthase
MVQYTGAPSASPVKQGLRALAGRRVVVTRGAHQAKAFEELLRNRGAVPLVYPCLSIQPMEDLSLLDAALRRAMTGQYDWLIVTSANTLRMVASRLDTLNLNPQALEFQIAAVGPKTAQAVELWLGIKAQVISDDYQSAGLTAGLNLNPGMRVLLPQAEIAPTTLMDAMKQNGVEVERIDVYKTVPGGSGGVDLARLIQWKAVDVLTFASPSAVRGFVTRMLDEAGQMPKPDHLIVGVIGPTTKQAALDAGLPVDVMPNVYTLENLTNALEQYFATH